MHIVSIAVVDDHPILREGLVALFSNLAGNYRVEGSGENAADAYDLAVQIHPDVMLLDLQMPGNVFETIARIRSCSPDVKILAFTASERVDHVFAALDAGADGYVLKGATMDELREAIDTVRRNMTYVTPSLSRKMIDELRHNAPSKEKRVQLTHREEQIVRLLSLGHSNKAIANQLAISEKTVKHYMTIIIHKLEVRNRLEVVLAAQRLGLLAAGARGAAELH